MDYINIDHIDETSQTAEQVRTVKDSEYMLAVVREKSGYEKNLASALDAHTLDETLIARLKQSVASCNDVLGAAAETREPRNKTLK